MGDARAAWTSLHAGARTAPAEARTPEDAIARQAPPPPPGSVMAPPGSGDSAQARSPDLTKRAHNETDAGADRQLGQSTRLTRRVALPPSHRLVGQHRDERPSWGACLVTRDRHALYRPARR